jgi:dGTPase
MELGRDNAALSERGYRWASTMAGHVVGPIRTAHSDSHATVGPGHRGLLTRAAREDGEDAWMRPGATRAQGAGTRARAEDPDPFRTCFERDRDRILHSPSFRRLAGKTQVFIFPADHQRTRLTHALEVAQVATSVARACGLNVALVEAIALGHDCGHGPGGHASEDALSSFLADGFDHAVWGADVSLASLNLCEETLDGIRNHSWSRPAPSTPEGEVVSWADRIAYVCHDWEDAVSAGIVTAGILPDIVRNSCGETRSSQLRVFIEGMVHTVADGGPIGMGEDLADVLAAFRQCNYDHVYLRPASLSQGEVVISALRALVTHFADHPNRIPAVSELGGLAGGSDDAVRAAVAYVAGMTDRYAMQLCVSDLGFDLERLPLGFIGR